MTTARMLWILWSLAWAAAWFALGLLTVVGVLLFWPLAFLSVLAAMLPVGAGPVPAVPPPGCCPICGATGPAELLRDHLQYAHIQTGSAR